MKMTNEEANRLLRLFEIPGDTEAGKPVRDILARLLASRAISLGELQTARDIVGRKPGTDPHAYLFLAAMFASLREGNTAFNLAREHNQGGGLLADTYRRRGDDEDAKAAADEIRTTVKSMWDEAVAAAAPLVGDVVKKDARGFWYFDKYGVAVKEVGETIQDRIGKTRDALSDAELDAVSAYKGWDKDGNSRDESLDKDQRAAVRAAVENRFAVVTGGPGTGKTTVLCSILRALFAKTGLKPADVALAAPTGRAAQRMGEALRAQCAKAVYCGEGDKAARDEISTLTGRTVHALLGAPNWFYNAENPLPHRLVVVDECSMVDLLLMQSLLSSLRRDCRIVLLGDRNQLPSVDAGAVLGDLTAILGKDLVGSGVFVELLESHRFTGRLRTCADEFINGNDSSIQSDESKLPRSGVEPWTSALHAVETENGCFLYRIAKSDKEGDKDFHERVDALLKDWAVAHGLGKDGDLEKQAEAIAQSGKPLAELDKDETKPLFDALDASRILTVVRKGPFGVKHVNDLLLGMRLGRNPAQPLTDNGIPVMVTKNTPLMELFNGDVGVTVKRDDGVYVLFPRGERVVSCPVSQLPEHELAYAITIHKSQGSEYENVLVVLPDDATHPLLSRQLVYTGITRAKKRAVILGTETALKTAIANKIERDTGIMMD